MKMQRLAVVAAAAALILVGLPAVAAAGETGMAHPAVEGFGGMTPLPDAAVQPDKTTVYKVIFNLPSDGAEPAGHLTGLEKVARAVNIFTSAGVPASNLKFVVVLHGPATFAVLDNEHYKEKKGSDNPNIALIAALKKAGVEVEVCGQALAGLKLDHAWVNKDVTITLSAISDLVIYGQQGYTIIDL